MRQTFKLISEMVTLFERYSRGEITRQEMDDGVAKIHVALNGPEAGELNLEGYPVTVGGLPRGLTAPRNDGEVFCRSPYPGDNLDLRVEIDTVMKQKGRAYILLDREILGKDFDVNDIDTPTVAGVSGAVVDLWVMLVHLIENQPELKALLLRYYGEQAMDLRVKTEAIKAMLGQDLDREIEAQENARVMSPENVKRGKRATARLVKKQKEAVAG